MDQPDLMATAELRKQLSDTLLGTYDQSVLGKISDHAPLIVDDESPTGGAS